MDTENNNLPALNVPLLRDLLTWAKQDKDALDRFLGWGEWEQEVWGRQITNGVCKSSYCMAGQAAVQAGYGLVYDQNDEVWDQEAQEWRDCVVAWNAAPKRLVGTDDKGNPKYELLTELAEPVRRVGQMVLGLTDYEQDLFFEADNCWRDLVNYANEFAANRGLEPVYVLAEDGDPAAGTAAVMAEPF